MSSSLRYQTTDTCVAFATPPGPAGLAVLRLSGPESAQISDRLFLPAPVRSAERALSDIFCSAHVQQMKGYRCVFGYLYDPSTGEPIDQVVITKFVAPHSYTGEDVVELSIHGGQAVKEKLLQVVLAQGARLAEPGEFTSRAFMNGKMDLAQAEAVMDIIHAEAGQQAKAAMQQLQGSLTKEIQMIREPLLAIMAKLELAIQYPEHEDSFIDRDELFVHVQAAQSACRRLLETYHNGKLVREGLKVILAGRPNAGKSTLFNRLLGSDKAIVTSIAGTTRDALEQHIRIDGQLVTLIDTAGLRESEDVVEQIGIHRSREAIAEADLVLWLFAADEEIYAMDEIERDCLPKNVPVVPIFSKVDLLTPDERERRLLDLHSFLSSISDDASENILFQDVLVIGAGKEETSVRKLIAEVITQQQLNMSGGQSVIITTERHFRCLQNTSDLLLQLETDLEFLPYDLVSLSLQAGAESLAEITGENVSESLWKEIFTKFCVGK